MSYHTAVCNVDVSNKEIGEAWEDLVENDYRQKSLSTVEDLPECVEVSRVWARAFFNAASEKWNEGNKELAFDLLEAASGMAHEAINQYDEYKEVY